MKTVITLAAIALAPIAASAETAAEIFALNNDSAAERIVGETSIGDVDFAQREFAQVESPAEMNLNQAADVTRGNAAQILLALSNDSAAERVVR
ncbi:MAG: hypothetical protein ABJ327_26675 [Litoreibacter sp.]